MVILPELTDTRPDLLDHCQLEHHVRMMSSYPEMVSCPEIARIVFVAVIFHVDSDQSLDAVVSVVIAGGP